MQDPAQEPVAPALGVAGSRPAPSPRTLIATAARIGDRLCELAIEDGDRCTWLVPEPVNSRRLTTTVARPDLYDGLAGIALFLAHLGAVAGKARYRRIAEAALREGLALCRKEKVGVAWLGAFQGVGGFAYALVHLAAIWHRPQLAEEALAIIRKFARRAARATDLDLIMGLSGFLVSGLVVARCNRDAALIEALRPAAERLLRQATAPAAGRTPSILLDDTAGVAHGPAGAGPALLRWAEATGEVRFRAAGEALIRKDFEVVEAFRRNPAGNPAANLPVDLVGWCRSSLGVAMAALGVDPPVADLLDAAWARDIAKDMARSRPSRPLHLCHGALGRLELLGLAEPRLLGGVDLGKALRGWRAALLNEIVGGRWVADVTNALETPTLMLRVAGTATRCCARPPAIACPRS